MKMNYTKSLALASTALIALGGLTLTAQPARADDCLLDTGGGLGVADDNISYQDTDLGASSQQDDTRLACGLDAFASGVNGVALGNVSRAAANSTAVGNDARAVAANSTALGTGTFADALGAVAVGQWATVLRVNGIAIGSDGPDAINTFDDDANPATAAVPIPDHLIRGAIASGAQSIAIGTDAFARGADGMALGSYARAVGINSTALGAFTQAAGVDSVAIGSGSDAFGIQAISIGLNATATGLSSIAIGGGSSDDGEQYVVSFGSRFQSRRLTYVGTGINATDAVNVGQLNAAISGIEANVVVAGTGTGSLQNSAGGSTANGTGAVALGQGQVATGNGAVAIGDPNTATGTGAVAIGADNTATGTGAVAIGNASTAGADGAVALGNGANAAFANSVALGSGAVASRAGEVALGGAGSSVRVGDIAASTAAQTGAIYMATTDANGTLGQGVDVSTLATGSSVTAEATTRAAADTVLQGNIDAETAARIAADTVLQTNITAEATARIAADSSLQTAINTEATTRAAADTALDTRVTTVEAVTATHTTQIAAIQSINTAQDNRMTTMDALNTTQNGRLSLLESGQAALFDLAAIDRKQMRQGVAAAMAMADAPMPSEAGKTSYALKGAMFRGEAAFSMSLTHRLQGDTPFALTASVSHSGSKNTGVSAGIAGEF